jgi:hypothetical protein
VIAMKKFASHIFNDAVMYYGIYVDPSSKNLDEHAYFAQLAKLGVHGKEAAELHDEVVAAIAENTPRRVFVCSFMHYTGANYGKLTSKQSWSVYKVADGFGLQHPSALREINGGWDWSHIRDSTIDGWKRMEKKLNQFGFTR